MKAARKKASLLGFWFDIQGVITNMKALKAVLFILFNILIRRKFT